MSNKGAFQCAFNLGNDFCYLNIDFLRGIECAGRNPHRDAGRRTDEFAARFVDHRRHVLDYGRLLDRGRMTIASGIFRVELLKMIVAIETVFTSYFRVCLSGKHGLDWKCVVRC